MIARKPGEEEEEEENREETLVSSLLIKPRREGRINGHFVASRAGGEFIGVGGKGRECDRGETVGAKMRRG